MMRPISPPVPGSGVGHVWATMTTTPPIMPIVCQRSSSASGSGRWAMSGSSNTSCAVSKLRPCFCLLMRFLFTSHVQRKDPIPCNYTSVATIEQCVNGISVFPLVPDSRARFSEIILVSNSNETVDRIIEATSGEAYSVQGSSINIESVNTESVTARVRGYEAACSTLLAMATIGGFWAEEEHYSVWQRVFPRLSTAPGADTVFWLRLKRYPGTLPLYALGLGAVANNRLEFLGRLFATTIVREYQRDTPAVEILLPY